jgi:hypothetical protein
MGSLALWLERKYLPYVMDETKRSPLVTPGILAEGALRLIVARSALCQKLKCNPAFLLPRSPPTSHTNYYQDIMYLLFLLIVA